MKNFSILALVAATMALSTKAIKIKAIEDEKKMSEIYFHGEKPKGENEELEVYAFAEPGQIVRCDGAEC